MADDFALRQLAITKKATEAVHKAQESQKEQFDKHRRDKEFEEGDKVMLSTKAFKAYSKQDPTFIGPYSIRKKFSPLVYELDLPKGTCFHWQVNIKKLKRYFDTPEWFKSKKTPLALIIKEGEMEYEVEALLKKCTRGSKKK